MARHSSILVAFERAARAADRAQRQTEIDRRRQIRDQLRHEREEIGLNQARQRLDRQQHQVSRTTDAQQMTAELNGCLDTLRSVLARREYPTQNAVFTSLEVRESAPLLTILPELAVSATAPQRNQYIAAVPARTWWESFLGTVLGSNARSNKLRKLFAQTTRAGRDGNEVDLTEFQP